GGRLARAQGNEVAAAPATPGRVGAPLPVGTDHDWAVALNGRLYVGAPGSNRVFSYDPVADAWIDVAPSTFLHAGTAVAAVRDGRIYLAGGTGGAMAGSELEVYDPATNRWTTLAPMTCARNHTAGGFIGEKLY